MLKGSATRERRSWTDEEDRLLREAVKKEDPNSASPSKWYAIAKHVPDRTNKDCRKRWFAKMASDVVKGGWSPDEDARLVKAIDQCGTRLVASVRWSMVAAMVQSRNSDQCAKRWTDTLNPAIDRTTWTPEGDALLLKAVSEHGKVWTKIVKTYFPGRTGLSAKNRYNSITRGNVDSRRSQGHSVSASGPVSYVQNVQPPSTSPSGPVVVHMSLSPAPIPQAMYNSPQGMRLPFPIS
ncbi:Homeodomain-like protein [Armillaria mellea]|nr:Homeodomain-like protein [Armillaria mellea]